MRAGPGIALVAALLVGTPPLVRAELPAGHEIDEKEICLVCHDLSEAMESKTPHAPVEMGECSACHNPHVSRFDALLRERPAPLCVSCHDDMTQELERAVVHPPVAEGRCVECHQPHGGDHANLLVRPAKELCRECHAALTAWEERSVKHPPFVQGRCSACHDAHAADHPGLAAKAGGGMCTTCHPVNAGFKQSHAGYPVETADCQQCHDPHGSSRKGLFRAQIHPPFEEGDCTTCHADASAGEPFALVETQAELCGMCHEEQVELARTATFPHVSAGGGRCSDCHNAHAGDGESLLIEDQVSVCLDCHDPGGSRSGQTGRFATHEDLDCATCHAPHGGDQPLLFQEDSVELCGQCHTHQHGIRHPLGEGTRDPRSGNPMSCLSCHGIHDSAYEMYLLASGEGDLCIACHKDIGQ